jgi:endo-alpha-N-acetylgalactosaminidase
MWVDGEKIGQVAVSNLPDVRGKVGLTGWFGNKNVTLDNLVVEELGGIMAPEVGPLEEQSIESDSMKVVLDNSQLLLDMSGKELKMFYQEHL